MQQLPNVSILERQLIPASRYRVRNGASRELRRQYGEIPSGIREPWVGRTSRPSIVRAHHDGAVILDQHTTAQERTRIWPAMKD